MKTLRLLATLTVLSAAFAPSLMAATPAHASTLYVVNQGSASCSDSGPGGPVTPFCSIKPAAKIALAGDTVRVFPGTYREQVTPTNSGTTGAPITFLAVQPGVIVMGSASLSNAAAWVLSSGNTWKHGLAKAPNQVLVDGARLAKGTGAGSLGTNEFFYDAVQQLLYVNVGGGNPATGHQIEASQLSYAFDLTAKTNIVVDAFEIKNSNVAGVQLSGSSKDTVQNNTISMSASYGVQVLNSTGQIVVQKNDVSGSGSHGIKVNDSTGEQVLNNTSHGNVLDGIAVFGSSSNTIAGNTVYSNSKPGPVRSAIGIDINKDSIGVGSTGNTIRANTAYSNQDSGIQVYNGSNNNTVARNLSYSNGDHGIDVVKSTGTNLVSNTAYGNTNDGLSVEGISSSTTISNSILANNGLYDLYVAGDGSEAGSSSDYDIIWKAAAGTPIRFAGVNYANAFSLFGSTGNESHGLSVDPMFANTAGGDYHPAAGSPAIDSANAGAAGFVTNDLNGGSPFDDPATSNTGAGSPLYADRGALEFGAGGGGGSGLSIDDVAVTEGNSATTDATFTVTLSPSAAGTVTVHYATANGTAKSLEPDYQATSGNLSFTAGQTSKPVVVKVTGDIVAEPNETFLVKLSAPSGASISDSQGVGTINDDDGGCTIRGTDGIDNLNGTSGNDVICSFGGNDVVDAGVGNDTVKAGFGNDNVTGGTGSDKLFGESGDDTLNGTDGVSANDLLNGGTGTDTCTGDSGDTKKSCP